MNNNGTTNTKKNFKNNSRPRKSPEEYEAEKKAQLERQSKNLDMIEDVASILDEFLTKGEGYKITMKDVLTIMTDTKGHAAEDTKPISQFSYILLDLANARKNTKISGDRLNIRVMYIEERLKTSYKSELHPRIIDMIKKYSTLFKWDEGSNGEDYTAITEKE